MFAYRKIVWFTAALVLGGCSGTMPRTSMTDREFAGLGWCIGLVEGAGEDASALRRLASDQARSHTGYYERRGITLNEQEAMTRMQTARGDQLASLQAAKDSDCVKFGQYLDRAGTGLGDRVSTARNPETLARTES